MSPVSRVCGVDATSTISLFSPIVSVRSGRSAAPTGSVAAASSATQSIAYRRVIFVRTIGKGTRKVRSGERNRGSQHFLHGRCLRERGVDGAPRILCGEERDEFVHEAA